MNITIEIKYNVYGSEQIDLPDGMTWDNVVSHYVKWDCLNVTFDNGTTESYELCTDISMGCDTKRPVETKIYKTNESGEAADYDSSLA